MNIDPIDAAIINVLRKRPGSSVRAIGRDVGRSPTPVYQRLLKLERQGLIEFNGGRGKAKARDNIIVHCRRVYEVYKMEGGRWVPPEVVG